STSSMYTLSGDNHNIRGDGSYIIAGPAMTSGLFVHSDAGDIHFRVKAKSNSNTDICLMDYSKTTLPPPANASSVPLLCEIDSAQDGTYVIVKNGSSGIAAQAIFTAIS